MKSVADLIVQRPEGLYCPPGDFYIDPWRRVDRAVITHAHADHARPGHAHYLAAAPGAGLLRARLGKGDFFGEISVLLGEAPVADITARTPIRALHLGGPDLHAFLLAHPPVMFRMLQSVSRRLVRANAR